MVPVAGSTSNTHSLTTNTLFTDDMTRAGKDSQELTTQAGLNECRHSETSLNRVLMEESRPLTK